MLKLEPTSEQKQALELLHSKKNIFLTGSAGTGKSFVVSYYLKQFKNSIPILASTGVAAVLVGGRTFHSFFGLGIMEGTKDKIIHKAMKSKKLEARIKKAKTLFIDEISMIDPEAFETASSIAQLIKESQLPFGGIRIVVIGDFFQLPPINKDLPWMFENQLWKDLDFTTIELKKSMRTQDRQFFEMLNQVRKGRCTEETKTFFNSRVSDIKEDFEGTVLFAHNYKVEAYNNKQLEKLDGPAQTFPTEVTKKSAEKRDSKKLIGMTPLPEVLTIKKNALVMIRKNDVNFKYVNGTLARVVEMKQDQISIKLLNGKPIDLERAEFKVHDADGKERASIKNFPITLAWATTIHKSQGASIDKVHVDLEGLWENGQAYVALSRAKSPEGLLIKDWNPASIKTDQGVIDFYSNLKSSL